MTCCRLPLLKLIVWEGSMGQDYKSFTKIQTLHLCLYFMFGLGEKKKKYKKKKKKRKEKLKEIKIDFKLINYFYI